MKRWELAAALGLDMLVGDPPGWPHPVRAIGAGIAFADAARRERVPERYELFAGAVVCACIVGTTAAVAGAIARRGPLLRVVAAASTLAIRSLDGAIAAVDRALRENDVARAREAVAHVVGRDTQTLDEAGVARAALEALAESFGDGVVAPLLALRVGGVAAAFACKAINTLDSMIGHIEAPYTRFGRVSARLDDAANFIPARVAALAIIVAAALVGEDARAAFAVARADARAHRSPNAGWPEAALAGALHVRLGGTNTYGGIVHAGAVFGAAFPAPRGSDIARARRLVAVATALVVAGVLASARR